MFNRLSLCSGPSHGAGGESVKRRSCGDDMAPVAPNGENRTEWNKTPPSGDDRWGETSKSHSDNWFMSTTWDMQLDSRGEDGETRAGRTEQIPTGAQKLHFVLFGGDVVQ